MGQLKRILICRTDRIGDFILSIPFAKEIRQAYPDAKIYWLIAPINRPLMEFVEPNDGFFVYDKREMKKLSNLFSFARQLKSQEFDVVIALNSNFRLHLLLFLSRIKRRYGWAVKGGRFFLTNTIEDTKRYGLMHEAQYNMLFLPMLEIAKWKRPEPRLNVPGRTFRNERPIIAVHTGASCPSKRWPIENFIEVIKVLLGRELDVILIGDKNEATNAKMILQQTEEYGFVLDKTGVSLKETVEILSGCDIIISNDSGPVHIAAALGLACVVIFGRNDSGLSPQRWAPLTSNKAVLHKATCEVCLAHKCRKGFICLQNISVQDVIDAFDDVFASAALKRRFGLSAS